MLVAALLGRPARSRVAAEKLNISILPRMPASTAGQQTQAFRADVTVTEPDAQVSTKTAHMQNSAANRVTCASPQGPQWARQQHNYSADLCELGG
jgi:hypothetical protein